MYSVSDNDEWLRERERKRFREEIARRNLENVERSERESLRLRLNLIAAYCRHRNEGWARDILRFAEEERLS